MAATNDKVKTLCFIAMLKKYIKGLLYGGMVEIYQDDDKTIRSRSAALSGSEGIGNKRFIYGFISPVSERRQ